LAAQDLLGVELAPVQQVVLEDMWFKNYVITVATRGFGKTFVLGTLSALSALLYPGYRVGLVSSSFRQAKFIFAEIEKLYNKSPILRQACAKRPIRTSDTCYLEFKNVGGKPGSYIEAMPIGVDGAKIRGSRFYLICVDELAQVPSKILDLVLRPMGATKQDPMEHVKFLQRKKELIAAGLATEEDFVEDSVNKMIMTSSGYYKFNHMYSRMRSYWKKMDSDSRDSDKYAVHQVPYTMLPEGFLDMDNVESARGSMPDHEFRMEYEADMVSDSEGFFKASVIEECSIGSGFGPEIKGDGESRYLMAVDPNQGGGASCGIVIGKLIDTELKLVFAKELKKNTTQEMVSYIQDMHDKFHLDRIYMDKMGGGVSLMNLLEEGYGDYIPLLDRNNAKNLHKEGLMILEMIQFTPSWIANANFTTLSLLEDKQILFPERVLAKTDMEDKVIDAIDVLKKQLYSIVVTETGQGKLHFDTPKSSQNKDLYSALIMLAYGVKAIKREEEEDTLVTKMESSGYVRPHDGSSWSSLVPGGSRSSNVIVPSNAILKPRIK
jgi:hypothetical protein